MAESLLPVIVIGFLGLAMIVTMIVTITATGVLMFYISTRAQGGGNEQENPSTPGPDEDPSSYILPYFIRDGSIGEQ